jgi:hypothetical protein
MLMTFAVSERREELHPNAVTISGRVTRAYRQDEDVVVRMCSTTGGQKHYVSLLLPKGRPIDGKVVSLIGGARLQARGYLHSVERMETYADLLRRIGHPNRIEAGDEGITLARTVTYIVADSLEILAEEGDDLNTVIVQGIVWRAWKLPRQPHAFARLAIYDEHAPLKPASGGVDGPGGDGRKRAKREAHYASVMFPDGQTVEGLPVHLTPHKDRKCSYHIVGYLHNIDYFERLSKILTRAKKSDRVRQGDEDIRVGRTTTYVIGQMVQEFLSPIRVEHGRSKN